MQSTLTLGCPDVEPSGSEFAHQLKGVTVLTAVPMTYARAILEEVP